MNIIGKKYLDKNTYDKMIIDLTKKDNIIKLTCANDIDTIQTGDAFSKDFRRTENDEIILKCVEHFLENTTINELNTKTTVKYYNGWYSVAKSDSRMLMLKLDDSYLSRRIVDMIFRSYNLNRAKYVFDKSNEIKSIERSYDVSKYGERIIIPIIRAGKISNTDQLFIRELLLDRFDGENYAEIEHRNKKFEPKYVDDYFNFEYLVCVDFEAGLDSISRSWVLPVKKEYNDELWDVKKRQLTFKGY